MAISMVTEEMRFATSIESGHTEDNLAYGLEWWFCWSDIYSIFKVPSNPENFIYQLEATNLMPPIWYADGHLILLRREGLCWDGQYSYTFKIPSIERYSDIYSRLSECMGVKEVFRKFKVGTEYDTPIWVRLMCRERSSEDE